MFRMMTSGPGSQLSDQMSAKAAASAAAARILLIRSDLMGIRMRARSAAFSIGFN